MHCNIREIFEKYVLFGKVRIVESQFSEEKLMILIIIPIAVAIASDATHIERLRRETVFIIQNHRDSENRTRCIEIDAAASNYVIVRN